jgi:hypothetical protein
LVAQVHSNWNNLIAELARWKDLARDNNRLSTTGL